MNQINIIHPHRDEHGVWRFTDPVVGVTEEPFVGDINRMIDAMTAGLKKPEDGFKATFSAQRFPGSKFKFELIQPEMGGASYRFMNAIEGWLCPVLLRYFDEPPKEIHIGVSNG